MVGGEWLIRAEGHASNHASNHKKKQDINQKFQITMEKLLN